MPATPSNSRPAGDDRNLVAVDAATAVTFEDKLRLFWQNNSGVVWGVCIAIILAILGKEGWNYMQRQKETELENTYAAATTPEQQKAFAAAHPDHPLAGVAYLQIGDDAYKAGKPADAVAAYDKAIASFKSGPAAARAQIGRAVANVQAGKASEGAAELKKLAEDATQLKAVRTEAAYDLTSLAVDAGNATDAQKYVDLLMQIDPTSNWTQRAMSLRATMPTTSAKTSTTSMPAPASATKKGENAPVQVKIPGK